jgi:tetratricopeptide (TPR) repeat protein
MNKNFTIQITGFILIFISLALISCDDSTQLGPVPPGVQAYSLLGDTLTTPTLTPEVFDEYNRNLIEAIANYRTDPEDPENVIWLGRRTAYLGEYREAVRIFTEGVFKNSDDPRIFRHRGHRYVTLRLFDEAIQDFEKAEELMKNMEDQMEEDGLPNEYGIPTSTLKSNVWYHKGLAHYLKGDFESAIESYEKALDLDLTEDMRVATIYWYYMSLKKLGRDEEAGLAVSDITEEMELMENDAYLSLILVFRGIFSEEHLEDMSGDALQNATLGYGIGNWHYLNGREDRAYDIWQQVYDGGNWAAFGFIAAEAELARVID